MTDEYLHQEWTARVMSRLLAIIEVFLRKKRLDQLPLLGPLTLLIRLPRTEQRSSSSKRSNEWQNVWPP